MGSTYIVPPGVAIKETEGFVRQLFNEKGELIYQEFIVGDDTEYFDHESKPLEYEEDDKRLDFYAPYDMVQPVSELEKARQDGPEQP